MTEFPIFIVDAFVGTLSGRILRGNPAAVVLTGTPQSEFWMQSVAAEMNLSETAFIAPIETNNFSLRWFTPQVEVDLCGHATLSSAHILWETQRLPRDMSARFHSRSGVLTARFDQGLITLDFPSQPVEACPLPDSLREALGLPEQIENDSAFRATDDWLIEVPTGHIEALRPDFFRLRELSKSLQVRGVIVTEAALPAASHAASHDFVSRFFAPGVGIDEDPVTGSAHTKLAPFWGKRLQKQRMTGFQASARGGLVHVEWNGDRVQLSGEAKTVLRGELSM